MSKMVKLVNKDIKPLIITEFNMLKNLEEEIKKYRHGRDIKDPNKTSKDKNYNMQEKINILDWIKGRLYNREKNISELEGIVIESIQMKQDFSKRQQIYEQSICKMWKTSSGLIYVESECLRERRQEEAKKKVFE